MTPEFQRRCQARRRAKADSFIAAPEDFKVCDQRNSVWVIERGICPLCHAYRFDESPERVIAVARKLGSSPFPFTAGTVPRY